MRSSFKSIAPIVGAAGKWLGRLTALLLLAFWGFAFVEHLFEWFLQPESKLPPLFVWLAQLCHLAIVVGLAMMIRWDKPGAVVTVTATLAFFLSIGVVAAFPLLNLVPIACFGVSWLTPRNDSNHR
jgi:hypothetical protein